MADGQLGIEGLSEELGWHRPYFEARCPPYARAIDLLPEVLEGPAGRYLAAAWEHRRFLAPYERPLLLLAAIRHDARAEGPSHPLWGAFAVPHPDASAVTASALGAALSGSRERVYDTLAHRSVQTNETSRAVAWLWPAALAGASGGRVPLALVDVGASAGLNLIADALPAPWTFEDGTPVEVAREVTVVARLGLDPAPLDATSEADADWLRACIWPGETAREARLEAALEAFRAARPRPDGPVLMPLLARNVPARLALLSAAEPSALVLAYQTVMREYLEPDERAEYEAGMSAWLRTHPPGRALWVELERGAGSSDPELGASIVAQARDGAGELRTFHLARCGFHPTRLQVDHGEVETFRAVMAEATPGHQEAPVTP